MQPGRRSRSTAASPPSAVRRARESLQQSIQANEIVSKMALILKRHQRLEHAPPAAQADLGLERQTRASASRPDSPGTRRGQPRARPASLRERWR
jgi:hypothetical protein